MVIIRMGGIKMMGSRHPPAPRSLLPAPSPWYTTPMTLTYKYLVFPDGDELEIDHDLRIDQMVDMNGFPMALPLKSSRIIAYRVSRIIKRESRGEDNRYFYLELIPAAELESFVRR